MKTIKVIDLLNKIANREELPNKIRRDGTRYRLAQTSVGVEYFDWQQDTLLNELVNTTNRLSELLDEEVDILDDDFDENVKIEKLEKKETKNGCYILNGDGSVGFQVKGVDRIIIYKLNEIIDKVNGSEQ